MDDKPPASTYLEESAARLRAELAVTFRETAKLLDQAAQLAREDAKRKSLQGDAGREAVESERAEWARDAARQARAHAERMSDPPSV